MEIRSLRYFLAVAREENMTKAAELLHVTQPTLSKALRSLEDELGKKLFTRHNFSISLTEEGLLLRDRTANYFSDLPSHTGLDILQKKYVNSKAFIPSSDTTSPVATLNRSLKS